MTQIAYVEKRPALPLRGADQVRSDKPRWRKVKRLPTAVVRYSVDDPSRWGNTNRW